MDSMKTFIITGRIPDKENETLWFQADSYAKAVGKFIKQIHEGDPEEKRRIVNDHGVAVYLDCVIEAKEFDIHLTAGWQEASDEAKKYADRKTAYER